MKLLFLCLLVLFFTMGAMTCEDLDEYQQKVNDRYTLYVASRITELEGTWVMSACDNTVSPTITSEESKRVTIRYNFTTRTETVTYYSADDCGGDTIWTVTGSRPFALEGVEAADPTKKKKKRFISIKGKNTVTFTTAASVAAANTYNSGAGAYGRNAWVLNESKILSLLINPNGTSSYGIYTNRVDLGWDRYFRDYYSLSGNILTIYQTNTSNPENNQYPDPLTVAVDSSYTRQ